MASISTWLELTHEEVEVLKRALNIRLTELRLELARTEDHEYHVSLRYDLDCLEQIHRELKGLPRKQST